MFIDVELERQKSEVEIIDLKIESDIQISIFGKCTRRYLFIIIPSNNFYSSAELDIFHVLILDN